MPESPSLLSETDGENEPDMVVPQATGSLECDTFDELWWIPVPSDESQAPFTPPSTPVPAPES